MPADVVLVTGKLPKVKLEDAARIAVYVALGGEIVAQQPLDPGGELQMPLARGLADARTAYALELIVGPAGMRDSIGAAPELQRVLIDRDKLRAAKRKLEIALDSVKLTKAVLDPWWLWCHLYCVNGQVLGSNGCPVPFAEVTVYTVDFALTRSPAATVTTDAQGRFTACFNWCSEVCWPCWPFWWRCWPWWCPPTRTSVHMVNDGFGPAAAEEAEREAVSS